MIKTLATQYTARAEASFAQVNSTPSFINGLGQTLRRFKVVRYGYSAGCFTYRTISTSIRIALKAAGLVLRYIMHHPIQCALNIVFATSLGIMAVTGSEISEQVILSQISEDTVLKIIETSQYNRGFSNEEMKREGARELTAAGGPAWVQREGIRAILYHARKAQLPIEDQAVLLTIANIESGFNPFAQANITTACGLFQFVRATGEMVSLRSAECMDPWKNAQAGVNHYIANFDNRVRPAVEGLSGAERAMKSFELSYYLHHDGPASSNPSNELKALVLDNTSFLFSAYHTLQKEVEIEKTAPRFSRLFANRMWSFITGLKDIFAPRSLPVIAWLTNQDVEKETA